MLRLSCGVEPAADSSPTCQALDATSQGRAIGVRFVDDPLVDHHCHGIARGRSRPRGVRGVLNEASGPSPLATTAFDSLVGLAVRRWCAPLLDLEPLATAEEYVHGGTSSARRR